MYIYRLQQNMTVVSSNKQKLEAQTIFNFNFIKSIKLILLDFGEFRFVHLSLSSFLLNSGK